MTEYKFTIPGRLPGLNEYIEVERSKSGRTLAARLKRETEEVICWEIRAQLKTLKIKKPVHITYRWVEATRRRDKDNISFAKKFVQDALVAMQVLENDGWRQITGFSDEFAIDKKRPRIEVTLQEVEG